MTKVETLKNAYETFHNIVYRTLAPLPKGDLESLLDECRQARNQFGQVDPWVNIIGNRIQMEIELRKMGFKEEIVEGVIAEEKQ